MSEPRYGVPDPVLAAKQARLDQEAADARMRAEIQKREAKALKWKALGAIFLVFFNLAALIASVLLTANALADMLHGDTTQPTVFAFVFWIVALIINLKPYLTPTTKKD
jgi:p-aminobenzoyl-glutamate transporter AbgT